MNNNNIFFSISLNECRDIKTKVYSILLSDVYDVTKSGVTAYVVIKYYFKSLFSTHITDYSKLPPAKIEFLVIHLTKSFLDKKNKKKHIESFGPVRISWPHYSPPSYETVHWTFFTLISKLARLKFRF